MSDGTFTEIGTVITDGKEYSINETGTWEFNNAGELVATLNQLTATFTVDKDGNLTLKGTDAPTPETRYTYEISNDYANIIISFLSDYTLTVTGSQLNEDGTWGDVNDTGTWSFNEDGTIATYLYGDTVIFVINEDGSLTMQGGGGSSDVAVLYTYEISNQYAKVTFSFLSDYTLTIIGFQFNEDGSSEEINDAGTWTINGEGNIEAFFYGETTVFTVNGDGTLTMQGGGSGGSDTPSTSILYTYKLDNDYAKATYNFLANGTLDLVGKQLTESDEWIEISAVALWSYDSEGRIVAIYGDQSMVFVIDADKNLTMQDDVTPETVTLYTYDFNDSYMSITVTFLSDYTFTYNGKLLYDDGTWGDVNETGTWLFTENGTIEADLNGDIAVFVINADRSLTMQGGGGEDAPTISILYTFILINDTTNITVSFMSDFNFEASGYYTDEKGNQIECNESFWWRYASDNAIMAHIAGDNRVFEIGEDGKTLTLVDTDDESATNVYTYKYETDSYSATLSFMSTYRLTATGWRLDPETGEYLEQFTSEGWWYYEDKFIVADIGANYGYFILLENGNIILQEDCTHPVTETMTMFEATCLLSGYKFTYCALCGDFVSEEYVDPLGHSYDENDVCTVCGANENDEAPTESYKYEYEDEEVAYVLSFLSNDTFTLTMLKGQVEEGVEKDYFVGTWYISEDGLIYTYLFGSELYRFEIGEDGSLSEYVCQHENTYTETFEPSCDEPGTSFTYCHDCGEMVGAQTLDPLGHNYGTDGVCVNCGYSESDGNDPDIKDVAYTYSGENRFTLTLYKDGSATGTKITLSADGLSYIYMITASWSADESGKIITVYEKTEIYTFTVGDGGVLTLINTESNSCAHEDTRTESDVVNCEQGGFKKVICNTCGLTVSSEFVSSKEHNLGEDGTCTDCGYIPCKHEKTTTETMFEATCLLSGYKFTYCALCGDFVSEEYVDPLGHSYDENDVCTVCGANENDEAPTESYKYEYEDEEVAYVLSFLSNDTFTLTMLKGQVDEGVEKDYFVGTWNLSEDGLIYAYLFGSELYRFEIGEDGSLSEYSCKHEITYTNSTPATCETEGYTHTYCQSCGVTVYESYTAPLGHTYKDGVCVNCGYSEGGGQITFCKHANITTHTPTEPTCTISGLEYTQCDDCGETLYSSPTSPLGHSYVEGICERCGRNESDPEPTELYSYLVKNQYTENTISFLSDFTFSAKGYQYSADGAVTEVNLGGTWSVLEDGRIEALLLGDPMYFVINEDGSLSEYACAHQNTTVDRVEPTCQYYGYERITCLDCEFVISDTQLGLTSHSYGETGVCVNCGYSENTSEIGKLYSYKDESTYLMLYADYTLEFKINSITSTGEANVISGAGRWHTDGDLIVAYYDGITMTFIATESGELVPYEKEACAHESTHEEQTEASCVSDGYIRLLCDNCGIIVSEEITETAFGHSYDESDICINCGTVKEKELYRYEVNNDYCSLSFSFSSNGSFTVNGWQLIDSGEQINVSETGKWWQISDGKLAADLYGSIQYFTINADGSLSMDEGNNTDCAHESTREEQTDASCVSDGYIRLICDNCGSIVSEEITETAFGHSYDEAGICVNCGFSENGYVSDCKHEKTETINAAEATCLLSGYQFENCTECGNDVSETYTEPLGHEYDESGFCVRCKRDQNESDPTEVYSFTLVDEYIDYAFSFNSDNTFRFIGMETDAEGNLVTMTFVGSWTISEDGKTIDTFFLGNEFVSFEVGEDGTLAMQGGNSSGPSCTHEYTDTTTVEPTCNYEGNIRTLCTSCGEVLHEETLSKLDHSYDETGICVNCGNKTGSDYIIDSGYAGVTESGSSGLISDMTSIGYAA